MAWCCARSAGSGFVVRIEDLDISRCRPGSDEQQLGDLAAIGLEWDQPVVRQSERAELYAAALGTLREAGLLYECWCTRSEIQNASSAPHGSPGSYPGTCRQLSATELAERRASGRKPAIRVRAERAQVEFSDRVHGRQVGEVDDFVVARQDGSFAYHLAVVVDDSEQSIDEVVRGDDLLSSTAAQCWLGEQLRLPRPRYVHLPLLRDQQGKRMSKRDSSATLAGQQAHGRSPDQVRGDLAASFGLCDRGDQPTPSELLSRFDSILVESPQ